MASSIKKREEYITKNKGFCMIWKEYCPTCKKKTDVRFLDCEDCKEQGLPCQVIICTECGVEVRMNE